MMQTLTTLDQSLEAHLRDAQKQPWRQGFLTLMRLLDARDQEAPRIGQSQRPQQESFRLGQQASLAFAPREIARIFQRDDKTHIHLFGLGMLGPNGALPIHYTEQVRERSEAMRDQTIANFLNIFHHRSFTHLYRAWAQSQAAAGLDRTQAEVFTNYVARLSGDEPSELQNSHLPPHARWASAAHRIRGPRDPEGLVSTLKRFFGVAIKLQEFRFHWMTFETQDRCRLGASHAAAMLGSNAMLGEKVPDRQTRFRLVIDPLSMDAYLRLTPQGSASGQDLPALVELVRSFIGFEYVWEVELLISSHAAPSSALGDQTKLGWSTWMDHGNTPSPKPITGMVFEPENYVRAL